MKLFGQYLVEKRLIKPEALLEALISQLRSVPTVAEIVHDAKLLPAERVLDAITLQLSEGLEFRAACRKLHIWTPSVEEAVSRELDRKRIPVGQLLVSSGALTLEALTQAFEDFQAARHQTPTDPTPGFEPKFQDPDPSALSDHLDLMTPDFRAAIERPLLASELVSDPTVLRATLREIHVIKGSSRFIHAELSERLMHQSEEVLTAALKKGSSVSAPLLRQALEIVWDLRSRLSTGASEQAFWKDPAARERYERLLESLKGAAA